VDFNNQIDKDLLTWWYVSLIKGRSSNFQPKVLVCFHVLGPNDELTNEFVHKPIALTELGQFRIGTIWRNKICRDQIRLDVETFQLDFDASGWSYTSIEGNEAKHLPTLIPSSAYHLEPVFNHYKTWLLQFKFNDNPAGLVIPCLEFFSRCYGRSAHVRRVLATHPWEIAKSELLTPLIEPAIPGTWTVNLKRRAVNGDVVLLAHLEYDRYARQQAQRIWAQLEAAQGTSGSDRVFAQVGPWFRGPARMKVKGIWLEDQKKFLGLYIIGGSEPDGVPVYRDRENTSKTGPLPGDVKNGGAWDGVPPRVIVPATEIIDVTSSEMPDQGSGSIDIEDPDYELLGTPRFVKDIYRSTTNVNGPRSPADTSDPDKFSGDEKSGTGKGTGYGSFSSNTLMESHGALRDVWHMLQFLNRHHSDIIWKVEYLTSESIFSDAIEPISLPGFVPFTREELELREIRLPYWPYLDRKNNKVRGALVARVHTPVGHIYFLEIQRRPKSIRKDGEKEWQGEESYKGLVFTLARQENIIERVKHLLDELRYTSGVFGNFAFSGQCTTFAVPHKSATSEKLPQERFVKRALSMFGVNIPEDPASVRLGNSDKQFG
jgi:hypothetical protein